MDFSIFLSFQRIRPPEYYKIDLFEEKLTEALLADRLGYSCI